MNWYRNMNKTEKRDFQKVVAVCTVGAIFILIIPIALQALLQSA